MSIARSLPQPQVDNPASTAVPGRTGRYGEQYTVPTGGAAFKTALADEGSYFVVTNPTPGTAVQFAVNASSDFTKSLFIVKNTAVSGGKRVYLDYVKVIPTVAPASATSMHFAVQVDSIARYTSGGTGPTAGVNVNSDSGVTSVGQLYYATGGAVLTTAAASTNVTLVARGVARSVIPAVLDEIVIQFGGFADSGSSSGTTAGRTSTCAPPVIVAPGSSAVFNVWFPSNSTTPLSYEFEVAWFER